MFRDGRGVALSMTLMTLLEVGNWIAYALLRDHPRRRVSKWGIFIG